MEESYQGSPKTSLLPAVQVISPEDYSVVLLESSLSMHAMSFDLVSSWPDPNCNLNIDNTLEE